MSQNMKMRECLPKSDLLMELLCTGEKTEGVSSGVNSLARPLSMVASYLPY